MYNMIRKEPSLNCCINITTITLHSFFFDLAHSVSFISWCHQSTQQKTLLDFHRIPAMVPSTVMNCWLWHAGFSQQNELCGCNSSKSFTLKECTFRVRSRGKPGVGWMAMRRLSLGKLMCLSVGRTEPTTRTSRLQGDNLDDKNMFWYINGLYQTVN